MLYDGHWIPIKDGDLRALALYRRHYSCLSYAAVGGRRSPLFCGPGEKIVLLTEATDALFVWRKFRDKSGQQGINCAIFRNEGPIRSSLLIAEAETWAWARWPGARLYTYVNPAKLTSPTITRLFWMLRVLLTMRYSPALWDWVSRQPLPNPGYCFKAAGWQQLATPTVTRRLLILERIAA